MSTRSDIKEECFQQFQETLDSLSGKLDDIRKIIEGNGHPGLQEQATLNTAHRLRMEKIIDGLWVKVIFIWITSMGTIAALIEFLGK